MNNPWRNIEAPKREFNVQRVSSTHPLPLYWGKDVRGGYLFIADLPQESAPDKKHLPELAGIRAMLGKGVNCTRLAFALADTTDWEIFLALCNDLIRASENAESKSIAVQVILRHLLRWHDFLKRPRSQVWPDQKIKGLIGELLLLEKPLADRFGWDNAVSFWHGPEGSAQDFIVYDTALEVKCQTGESRPCIQISSIEQLVSQLPRLFLTVHTLAVAEKDADRAFTLNSLATRVRDKLSVSASDPTRERFETLLFQTGYVPLEAYDERQFRLIATRSFEVLDNFPRLLPDSIPEGIERVSYQISLESIAPFEATLNLEAHCYEC